MISLKKKMKNIYIDIYPNISKYTGQRGRHLNNLLKNESLSHNPETIKEESLLNNELESLPTFSFKKEITGKGEGISLDLDLIGEWFSKNIGKIIMFPNFLSTSKREFDYGTFYLKITLSKQSNGKYVGAMFNTNSKEEEVLFKSKSKFKITGVKKREDKAYNVFLEEVISEKHDIIMYDRLVEKEMNKANKVDNNINASDLGLIWRIIV